MKEQCTVCAYDGECDDDRICEQCRTTPDQAGVAAEVIAKYPAIAKINAIFKKHWRSDGLWLDGSNIHIAPESNKENT